MVGKAIYQELRKNKDYNLMSPRRDELNLLNQQEVLNFFKKNIIDELYLSAAIVGGISANQRRPADFIHDNIMIQSNVINSAYLNNINKILFFGSACIYPKFASQPIKEEYLLTDELEKTNEAYAIAKIAGIKMCESYNFQHGTDYRSIMPTNLYGPHDNFNEEDSHVIPGLISKFYKAAKNNDDIVNVWGSGKPTREFLYVKDLASAAIHVMGLSKKTLKKEMKNRVSHINIGTGTEITIKDLATKISKIIGYQGNINFDKSMPDGTPRKVLDINLINKLGWNYKINIDDGLSKTIKWYLDNLDSLRT